MANRWGNNGKSWETLFSWAPKLLQMVSKAMKLKDICSLEESYDQPRQHIKKQRHYLADKSLYSQNYGFPSSHACVWELDHKEGWMAKNWCLWTIVLEKTLKSPLDCSKIQPVNPKGNQHWIFIRRTDTETEALIFGHLTRGGDSCKKTLMVGKIEGRKRRGW